MSNTEIILNGKFNDMYQQAIATGANKQYLSTLYKKLVKTQQDEQLLFTEQNKIKHAEAERKRKARARKLILLGTLLEDYLLHNGNTKNIEVLTNLLTTHAISNKTYKKFVDIEIFHMFLKELDMQRDCRLPQDTGDDFLKYMKELNLKKQEQDAKAKAKRSERRARAKTQG